MAAKIYLSFSILTYFHNCYGNYLRQFLKRRSNLFRNGQLLAGYGKMLQANPNCFHIGFTFVFTTIYISKFQNIYNCFYEH